MELTIYIITWLVIAYFITALPSINLTRNLILYIILIILMVSASTILSLDLGLIQFTKDKLKSLAVTLCRDIITPLLLVILSNIFSEQKTYLQK